VPSLATLAKMESTVFKDSRRASKLFEPSRSAISSQFSLPTN
jgi:hypothetical protein